MKNVTHERRVFQWIFMSSLEVIDFAYDILIATFIYKARCTAGSRKIRYGNRDKKKQNNIHVVLSENRPRHDSKR
jgi:hypothetical protein